MIQLQDIEQAMTVKLDDFLPEKTIFQEGIRRAPDRGFRLTKDQTELALKMHCVTFIQNIMKS